MDSFNTVVIILSFIGILFYTSVVYYGFKVLKLASYVPSWKRGWALFISAILLLIINRVFLLCGIVLEYNYLNFVIPLFSSLFLQFFIYDISLLFKDMPSLHGESRFITLLKHLPVGVVIYGNDISIDYINDKAMEILGVSDSVEGDIKNLYFTREDGSILPENEYPVNIVLSTGVHLYYKIYGIDVNGFKKCVLLNAYPTTNGDGQVILVLVDITDLKNAEESCRMSEDRYRKIFMASHDAVVISRKSDGLIYSVNTAFLQLTGYSEEEVVGKTVIDVNLWNSLEDSDTYIALLEKGPVRDYCANFLGKGNVIISGLVSGSIISMKTNENTPADNYIISSCKVYIDQTQNRRKEDKLKELQG